MSRVARLPQAVTVTAVLCALFCAMILAARLFRSCGFRDSASDIPVDPEKPADLVIDLGGGTHLEMVLVQPGEVLMLRERAAVAHIEKVDEPFYLGRFEVTEEQWRALLGEGPRHPFRQARGPGIPVHAVSFDDCARFLAALNARIGGGRFTLPSEAQWEYACRAGASTNWCFGDDPARLNDFAWYDGNSGDGPPGMNTRPHAVGTRRPNEWGLYDMHGNVAEWCADPWRLYVDDDLGSGRPRYLEDAEWGVVRGGSFGSGPEGTMCSRRGRSPRSGSDFVLGVGLRVARKCVK